MILDKFGLTDKVAIVTGSGSGLGRSIARIFAQAGANIVVTGINIAEPSKTEADLEDTTKEIEAFGRKTIAVSTDFRVAEQVENMVQATLKEFGGIDILVNNAGGGFYKSFLELSDRAWDAIVKTNLTNYFLCLRAVGKVMVEQKSGVIVNIGSMGATGSSARMVPYGAAKAAIHQLTQSLSVEWAPYNIRVNAIAPGPMETFGLIDLRRTEPERAERMLQAIPLKRAAHPDEVALAALFLASEAASYITGQILHVCGGELGYNEFGLA